MPCICVHKHRCENRSSVRVLIKQTSSNRLSSVCCSIQYVSSLSSQFPLKYLKTDKTGNTGNWSFVSNTTCFIKNFYYSTQNNYRLLVIIHNSVMVLILEVFLVVI